MDSLLTRVHTAKQSILALLCDPEFQNIDQIYSVDPKEANMHDAWAAIVRLEYHLAKQEKQKENANT